MGTKIKTSTAKLRRLDLGKNDVLLVKVKVDNHMAPGARDKLMNGHQKEIISVLRDAGLNNAVLMVDQNFEFSVIGKKDAFIEML